MSLSVKNIVISVVVIAAAFYAGMSFQSYLYDDTCLDMGGGRNPGNHPICVIDAQAVQQK
ncbi:MAG: hypothetical protein Q4A84_03040 [Neisseria sp.]|uniref:hypothetical protein n=1 Tax=Neisseria sp. TaxID=192066 RepID=UPI0026DCA5D6|nr:hypothetical protein [Neisseria sp.]MDO4640665.1 hypothetical protein [Neisseria sp.]